MGRSGPRVYHSLFVSVGLLVCASQLCLPPACLTACLRWEQSGLGVPALNIHPISPNVQRRSGKASRAQRKEAASVEGDLVW